MLQEDVGARLAYIELLKVLLDRKIITSDDIQAIVASLTDLSGAFEMKPSQRASIESFSKTLMRLRPDKPPT
jgi:hypothetical protein